eukprot:TRINITY_DN1930_c0_g4_i3.p1 TRINITY_DN1930_c0_g4~~TRINITY_DN1930_c0_g4_i3.p1  ORF type:complete len:481 (-),score=60.15 TRINITY_DN1930_c0_g4_i3:258-1700(-)
MKTKTRKPKTPKTINGHIKKNLAIYFGLFFVFMYAVTVVVFFITTMSFSSVTSTDIADDWRSSRTALALRFRRNLEAAFDRAVFALESLKFSATHSAFTEPSNCPNVSVQNCEIKSLEDQLRLSASAQYFQETYSRRNLSVFVSTMSVHSSPNSYSSPEFAAVLKGLTSVASDSFALYAPRTFFFQRLVFGFSNGFAVYPGIEFEFQESDPYFRDSVLESTSSSINAQNTYALTTNLSDPSLDISVIRLKTKATPYGLDGSEVLLIADVGVQEGFSNILSLKGLNASVLLFDDTGAVLYNSGFSKNGSESIAKSYLEEKNRAQRQPSNSSVTATDTCFNLAGTLDTAYKAACLSNLFWPLNITSRAKGLPSIYFYLEIDYSGAQSAINKAMRGSLAFSIGIYSIALIVVFAIFFGVLHYSVNRFNQEYMAPLRQIHYKLQRVIQTCLNPRNFGKIKHDDIIIRVYLHSKFVCCIISLGPN